jgi:preprotein translocase SecE subunit
VDKSYIAIIVLAVVFAFLWKKGYVAALARFSGETKQELLKCSWPSAEELKGSTIVVVVATLCIAVFTFFSDFLVQGGLKWLLTLTN